MSAAPQKKGFDGAPWELHEEAEKEANRGEQERKRETKKGQICKTWNSHKGLKKVLMFPE